MMKQIKLNGTAVGRDVAEHAIKAQRDEIARLEKSIADLQAQLDAPEVELWEGQLVEVYDSQFVGVIKRFGSRLGKGCFDTNNVHWNHCRPLQDPLILQFKPHKPGDPCPCRSGEIVHVMYEGGFFKMNSTPGGVKWGLAIGWMPAAGWGRSE